MNTERHTVPLTVLPSMLVVGIPPVATIVIVSPAPIVEWGIVVISIANVDAAGSPVDAIVDIGVAGMVEDVEF